MRAGPFHILGAGERSRTLDLRITNALLYQLSYTGENADSSMGFQCLPDRVYTDARLGENSSLDRSTQRFMKHAILSANLGIGP